MAATKGSISANGNTYIEDVKSASAAPGNITTVYVWGTFDSATVKVQVTPNGTDLFDFTDNSLTADGFISFSAKTDGININVAGGTSPDLNYEVL